MLRMTGFPLANDQHSAPVMTILRNAWPVARVLRAGEGSFCPRMAVVESLDGLGRLELAGCVLTWDPLQLRWNLTSIHSPAPHLNPHVSQPDRRQRASRKERDIAAGSSCPLASLVELKTGSCRRGGLPRFDHGTDVDANEHDLAGCQEEMTTHKDGVCPEQPSAPQAERTNTCSTPFPRTLIRRGLPRQLLLTCVTAVDPLSAASHTSRDWGIVSDVQDGKETVCTSRHEQSRS